MKKIIIIGEAQLDITIADGQAAGSSAGAILLQTACALASTGHHTLFAAEIGLDPVGDLIVDQLHAAGVDLSMLDRFAGGATQVALHFPGRPDPLRYERMPSDECFDMVWPRVEAGDVVVFGEQPSWAPRDGGQRLRQFLDHARDRQATVVYYPGLDSDRVPRATRIMPQVFENLEQSDAVIYRTADLQILFGLTDPDEAFRSHLSFHVDRAVCLKSGQTLAQAILELN